MTDNITLPRAVAERIQNAMQFLVDALEYDHDIDALAALDAALAKPDAKREPTHPGYILGAHWLETAYSRIAAGEAEAAVLAEVLGERGWVKPQPATMQQIAEAYDRICEERVFAWQAHHLGWRDAEEFHGIVRENGK